MVIYWSFGIIVKWEYENGIEVVWYDIRLIV